MAVILGQISGGIYVRDFDTEQSYENGEPTIRIWPQAAPQCEQPVATMFTSVPSRHYLRELLMMANLEVMDRMYCYLLQSTKWPRVPMDPSTNISIANSYVVKVHP